MPSIASAVGYSVGRPLVPGNISAVIRALFASNEQGAWYDPSDLSSMFQDAAGTIPAAVNQPVGLRLDKRFGLRWSENIAGITEPTVAQLEAKGTNLATDSTPGDPLHSTWVRFVNNSITTYAYRTLTIPSRVVSFSIDVEMLDVDTPPTLLDSSVASNGMIVLFGDGGFVPQMTKIAPYRYRFTVPRYAKISGTGLGNFGIVVYDTNTFRPMRISGWDIRELPGNHAYQTTASSRPILRQDGSGLYYLEYDGIDDFFVTQNIDFTGTDKMTVIAGVRKGTDALGTILETSSDAPANNGAFYWLTRATVSNDVSFGIKTTAFEYKRINVPAGVNVVLSTRSAAGQHTLIRNNGSDTPSDYASSAPPPGNLGNYPLYIGRRAGTYLPYNGREYGIIIRGAATDLAMLSAAERFMTKKTIGSVPEIVAPVLPLDALATTAKAAYSVRKLRNAYTGPCLKARRVVNDALQDIGFDTNGVLDTTALTTFAAGSAIVVEVWYDQSGNGYHLGHFTEGIMPQIYTGAALNTLGTRPCLLFDATDDALFTDTLPQAQPFMQSMVWSVGGFATVDDFPQLTGNGPNVAATSVDHYVHQGSLYGKAPTDFQIKGDLVANTSYQTLTSFNGATSYGRVNKVQSEVAQPGGANALNGFKVAGSSPITKKFGEIIIFAGTLSAGNITTWEANQATFWGLP